MNRLTLFGEFVEGLREHFASNGSWEPEKYHLVWEITRQDSASQVSRYMREHGANRELFSYHKSTIAQIIASSYADSTPDRNILRRRGVRGYEFVGKRDDATSVKALGKAIDGVMGPNLRDALHRCPLKPDSAFCKKMYRLYDERYGREGQFSSDLERYILSVDEGDGMAKRSEEIYRRLLLAILLGPEAIPTIATFSHTATMADTTLDMAVDGFALTQLVEQGREIVPLETYGFELDSEVIIGLSTNPNANYIPVFEGASRPYVSSDHAAICRDETSDGGPAWKLVNHSTTNGTAIRRVGGEIWFTKIAGESAQLVPGDEIWLAPSPGHGVPRPEYRLSAVLRFDHILSQPYRGYQKDERKWPERDTVPSEVSATPVFTNDVPVKRSETVRIGFVLEDPMQNAASKVFRYNEIADDDGGFAVSLGRRGDYETGGFLGSAVSQMHAVIEPSKGSDKVTINNSDENEIVVRHVGGTFDELSAWRGEAILEDGDEVYFAGGVSGSSVFVASNGSIVRFRYLYGLADEL